MPERKRASAPDPGGGVGVLTREGAERPGRATGAPSAASPATWWRASLLLFLAFCLLGAVPAALAGNFTGAWSVRLPGAPQVYTTTAPTATPAPDLALPRQAWVAASVVAIAEPGSGSPIATLDAGFPVILLKHALVAGGSWSQIQWDGPVSGTGGSGWVPDSTLVSYGGASHPIGDLGALSPALAQALAPYASQLAVSLYFPDSGRLYRVRDSQPFMLGGGFSSVLLADSFATAAARKQPPPATSATSQAARVAGTDAPSSAALYTQLGAASGVAAYLQGIGVSGIQPAANDWSSAQATPAAMLRFYDALADGGILSTPDRDAVLSLLAKSNAPATARLLDPGSLQSGSVLVVGVAQTGSRWTLSACGVVRPVHGSHYVVAAVVTGQPSQAAAQQVLSLFYGRLAALLAQ